MSQHDLTIDNQGFPAFRADLNNALQALGSTQSGTTAPSPTFANQLWYDTTNNQLKIRNEDNDAWIVLATLDQTGDVTSGVGAKTLPAGDIVGTSDSQTLTNKTINASQLVDNSVTPAKLSSTAQYTGYKNRIINGAMNIDQRNAGAATANTINGYTLDRWRVFQSVAGKFTVQQNGGGAAQTAGFSNYLGITSSSAYSVQVGDYYLLDQPIEGFNIADFDWGTANAKTVTLSFWVRSSLTGTFSGGLTNANFDRTYAFTYTISSANTWEYKTITITGDTTGSWLKTNGLGTQVRFVLGCGAARLTSTTNQWIAGGYDGATGSTSVVGTNGATFYITGVQLEVGSTATSFDYRPFGTELALCHRYFYRLNRTTGGDNTVAAGANSALHNLFVIKMSTELRAKPTISKTGTAFTVYSAGTNTTNPTLATTTAGTQQSRLLFNLTGTSGNSCWMDLDNDNTYFDFSSEL